MGVILFLRENRVTLRIIGVRGRLVWVNCSTDGGQPPRGLPSSPASLPHRLRDHSNVPHRQSDPASARSAHPSCNGRIFAMGSHRRRSTQHMPWQCCRGTYRCRSKGQHSRFGSLPNRCRCCWSSGLLRLVLTYPTGNPPPFWQRVCQLSDCHQMMGVPSVSVTVPAS